MKVIEFIFASTSSVTPIDAHYSVFLETEIWRIGIFWSLLHVTWLVS
jgi:hypothetical protein